MTKKNNYLIETSEYVIDSEHPSSKDYKIYYKGKLLNDVTGIIRVGGYEDYNEK